jgi:hypothetical protein
MRGDHSAVSPVRLFCPRKPRLPSRKPPRQAIQSCQAESRKTVVRRTGADEGTSFGGRSHSHGRTHRQNYLRSNCSGNLADECGGQSQCRDTIPRHGCLHLAGSAVMPLDCPEEAGLFSTNRQVQRSFPEIYLDVYARRRESSYSLNRCSPRPQSV